MSSDEVYSRLKKNRKKKRGPVFQITMWVLFFLVVLFLVGCGVFTYYASTAPNISYKTLSSDNSTTIYDRNGKVISRLGMQNRDYVKQKDIPENMKNAIISVEDRHFYTDKGVDPVRIAGAAVNNLFGGGGLQGGSTLTQQLVKLSVFSTKASDQTIKRKAQEAWLATKVNREYSKQQILEFYINKVYMGNNAYGMQTASEVMYHKPLSELDLAQTALLAGLPQAPVAYNPVHNPKYATSRRNQVLEAMVKNKAITRKQANQAEQEDVQAGIDKQNVDKTPTQKDEKYADAYIGQVLQEMNQKGYKLNAGNKVYTNIDMDTQKQMYQLANDDNSGLNFPNNDFQIGATMTNPNNGKIVAMLGSRKQNIQFGLNRAVQTDHSSGSTMKPLMDYGPAIEYLNYPTYQPVKDTPYTYPGTNRQLHDFDNKYEGTMTMRQALVESRNIPAIRTLEAVGVPRATEFLNGLGMSFKEPLNLQNGIGAYISTKQEAAAYAAFANGGTYYKPYAISKVETPTGETKTYSPSGKEAMSESTAFMITDMLKGVMTDPKGSGTAANIPGLNQAGKTGTTQYPDDWLSSVPENSSMDSWFTGYTKNLSLSVWTGYDKPLEPGHYISQSQSKIAQLFYKEIMQNASQDLPNDNWTKPANVVKTKVDNQTQYYIAGHAGDLKENVIKNNTQAGQTADNKAVVNLPNNQPNKQEEQTTDKNTNSGTTANNEQKPAATPQTNNNEKQTNPEPAPNNGGNSQQQNNSQPTTGTNNQTAPANNQGGNNQTANQPQPTAGTK
ncbi:PBP1A family penicillin-binding protein [Fructilactobacillus myrtifloralis]|uniref:PBP1A family penicillin-binding protein n=1 Tax=Fructilactobacillus myrtifloralis TaxID=2940301 RepID=A0ABY5BST4_9LACO|nr:PBP1A family penicillin-binding protein [Fructilactobacillus myrtifloralis]USS85323.1 PBP1A family penicillin-binding protein [Fructilactobacillus myrtifloralis]